MAKQSQNAHLDAYYASLEEFARQGALHEGAVSTAFQTLLADTARRHHWTLIPQLHSEGIRPDGTLKDPMGLVRGHWEAKDSSDQLDVEISKKIKKGYPLGNIIFEDTREAVLYQNDTQVMRIDLRDRDQLARLLQAFFEYAPPQIESFGKAVTEFKERVPEIATHLKEKIVDAHKSNKKFQEAFASFLELCRTSLNPNISQDAVDDMLVQHLLTERLIREIFDNPEFTRRNVIAAEIEKVIDALTSKTFDRNLFLKSLDRFYVAIENAARTITEWSDKQHFLNTVYERFFQGYSVKLADTMGIVYTPQPIVDFMCASVAEVLEKEFGKSLGDKDVNILDPCTGTGNFVVNLLRRIPQRDLDRVYREQLFANEVMLLPYYIAALNIEHAYYELRRAYEPFLGLCFVDTLDLRNTAVPAFAFMNEANTKRVERERKAHINVIIGNPPYNVGQLNENDNNKNRVYRKQGKADPKGVDDRISETYAKDSKATNKNALSDMFVKFWRWAADRLDVRDGIVCFVTNNAFVENIAYDGMRKHLLQDFDTVYHIDLRGNVRQNPKLSGTAYNVFGIQVGVGITLAVRHRARARDRSNPREHEPSSLPPPRGEGQGGGTRHRRLLFHRFELEWRRETKLQKLADLRAISGVKWMTLKPDAKNTWLVPTWAKEFAAFLPIAQKDNKSAAPQDAKSLFWLFSGGVKTNRDETAYDFDRARLEAKIQRFIEAYNIEVHRWSLVKGKPKTPNELRVFVDNFADRTKSEIQWSESLKSALVHANELNFSPSSLRRAIYRPFTAMSLCFDRIVNERVYKFPQIFPTPETERENRVICLSAIGTEKPFYSVAADSIPNMAFVGFGSPCQCFPFYTYNEDGSNRRENITDWALDQFRARYKDKKITKWDIFHYVYSILHHPGYRTKFADNLKRELPRIPFAPDFRAFAAAGEKLAQLHLDYEKLEPWKLKWIETPGVPLSYRVEKMKLNKDKTSLTVNESLTLASIPPDVFEYRLGNRSALDWVIDQYQVSADKRSGIISDPNRDDDDEYIVRLVGQVTRVSVETVKLVRDLPEAFC